MPKDKNKPLYTERYALAVVVSVFVFMSGYEAIRRVLFPETTVWQSYAATVGVTAVLAFVGACFFLKRTADLDERLERKLRERTHDLENAKKTLEEELKEKKHIEDMVVKSKREWETTFDSMLDWVSLIDMDSRILKSNRQGEKIAALPVEEIIGRKCCSILHKTDEPIEGCPLPSMLKSNKRESVELQTADGRWMMVSVDPVKDDQGGIVSAVHIVRDITKRKQNEIERERLNGEVKKATMEVKKLSGLLPICAVCKKIRDDKGYWNRIKAYIRDHSEAEFSHSICPECVKEHYPELDDGRE